MKEARYIEPVMGETVDEANQRKSDNFYYFKAFYFEIYMHLPSDTRFDITERYHLDKPVKRDELLHMAEEANVEIPEWIKNGDMDPRMYEEEIYQREPFWQEA